MLAAGKALQTKGMEDMKKALIPVAIVLSLFLSLPAANAATDLPESHPFYEEIDYLMEKGVIESYPDGTVQPDAFVTRAEAAVMFGRLKGLSSTKRATAFRDVPVEHFASGSIAEAAKAGYILGFPDGTFRPDEPVNRGDLAVMIERFFGLNFIFHFGYKDVAEKAYYHDAVCRLAASSISYGYSDNTFRPHLQATRGEFSALLARALEPEFKNDVKIGRSYQRDKTKIYTYRHEDGQLAVDRFVSVPAVIGPGTEFVWETRIGDAAYPELEYENDELFANGFPYSEQSFYLAYPVQVGKKFTASDHSPGPDFNTITGVGETVETEYKTFTNAVEVTTQDGGKYYMVEGFALVKWIEADGTVSNELIDVE